MTSPTALEVCLSSLATFIVFKNCLNSLTFLMDIFKSVKSALGCTVGIIVIRESIKDIALSVSCEEEREKKSIVLYAVIVFHICTYTYVMYLLYAGITFKPGPTLLKSSPFFTTTSLPLQLTCFV